MDAGSGFMTSGQWPGKQIEKHMALFTWIVLDSIIHG